MVSKKIVAMQKLKTVAAKKKTKPKITMKKKDAATRDASVFAALKCL